MLEPADFLRSWRELPIVVIDFETTGLDPTSDAAVEIGVVRFEGGEEVERFGTFLNPGMPIPAEATAVHGIKDEDVRDAPSLDEALFGSKLFDGAVPAGYNGHFDKAFLHKSERRGGLAFDPVWPWLDPLVMIREVDRYVKGKGRHTLEATCKRHGIVLEGAHRAVNDAAATGRLLFKLADRMSARTIGEMLVQQGINAKAQNDRFEAWKAKQPPVESNA